MRRRGRQSGKGAALKYKIIMEGDIDDLAFEINHALAEGWKLQGGVSITSWFHRSDHFGTEYAQALYLPEGETKDDSQT